MKKEGNPIICDNTDKPRGYYTKWNKSDRERHTVCSHLYIKSNKTKLTETENPLVVIEVGG